MGGWGGGGRYHAQYPATSCSRAMDTYGGKLHLVDGKMAQQTKMLATKPNNLGLISRTHMMGGNNQFQQVAL